MTHKPVIIDQNEMVHAAVELMEKQSACVNCHKKWKYTGILKR